MGTKELVETKTPDPSYRKQEGEKDLRDRREGNGGSIKGIGERDENVKKDILAAVTFLATGLLFYVVQTENQADELFNRGVDCDAAETVWVKEAAPNLEPQITLDSSGLTRDS